MLEELYQWKVCADCGVLMKRAPVVLEKCEPAMLARFCQFERWQEQSTERLQEASLSYFVFLFVRVFVQAAKRSSSL